MKLVDFAAFICFLMLIFVFDVWYLCLMFDGDGAKNRQFECLKMRLFVRFSTFFFFGVSMLVFFYWIHTFFFIKETQKITFFWVNDLQVIR